MAETADVVAQRPRAYLWFGRDRIRLEGYRLAFGWGRRARESRHDLAYRVNVAISVRNPVFIRIERPRRSRYG